MLLIRPLVHVVAAALVWWTYRQEPMQFGPVMGAALDRTLWFGLFATVALYLALLPGPLYAALPGLPGRRVFTHARRALGIDAAVFAGLHGYHGLWGWVGGIEGLRDWSWDYNVSLLLGAVAFGILAVLALTSFDVAVSALGRWWKRLHRLVYLAGVLVVAHAAIVTIHILDLQPLLVTWFVAITLLLLLELFRIRERATPRVDAVAIGTFFVLVGGLYWSTFLIGHHRH